MIIISCFIVIVSSKAVAIKKQIWIEAEKANQIIAPLQVADLNGASESKGVVAIGNHFVSEGYAKYNFNVSEDGEYIIWGRCFWLNLCTNSFKVAVDDLNPEVIGEDPSTNQWHWIMGPKFKLKKGKHELILWNREQDSQIDKFLITADNSYIPMGLGTSNSISEDFEEGVVPEKMIFSNKNRWKIIADKASNNKMLFLTKASIPSKYDERVLLEVDNPNKYFYRLAYKLPQLQNDICIYFNYRNNFNYYKVSMHGNSIDILKVSKGSSQLIAHKSNVDLGVRNKFQDFSIQRDNRLYKIKNNGVLLFTLSNLSNDGKFVGVGSYYGNLCLDNIAITSEDKILYTENFHATRFQFLDNRPEISREYLMNLKTGCRNWWNVSGNWINHQLDGFDEIEGRSIEDADAMVVFGDDFWENYSLQAATKTNSESGVGIVFNFQDAKNYNLFKWLKENYKWKRRLIKVLDGKATIMAEAPAMPMNAGANYWYKVNFKICVDSVEIFIDDNVMFKWKDKAFKRTGKVGFWTNSTSGACFDDIKISSTENFLPKKDRKFNYDLFTSQADIATSYCDWIPSYNDAFKLIPSLNPYPYMCIDKRIFDDLFLYNKRTFRNNFRISSFTSHIPRDVSAVYQFFAYNNGIKSVYSFNIGNNEIIVYKDQDIILSKKLSIGNRKNIEISKVKDKWKLKIDTSTLSYTDKMTFDSVKIGLGYSGIGKGQIILKQISIEDELNQTASKNGKK